LSPGEAKNYSKVQAENDYVEGKCDYEILGLKTGNEEVCESNCWSANWLETNQFIGSIKIPDPPRLFPPMRHPSRNCGSHSCNIASVLNDPSYSLNPFGEHALQLFKNDIVPDGRNYLNDFI
jgi:hypothetical protein